MDVKQGGSVYRASKEHGIPRKTLRNWMKRWNIQSVFSTPARLRAGMEIAQSQFGRTDASRDDAPLLPTEFSIVSAGSGITIAPAAPAVFAQPVRRTRNASKTFDSGITIAPATPAVLVKPRF